MRSNRRRRREFPPGELMLAAMVDMMINLLIFLLTLYGTDPIEVRGSVDLQLASSQSHDPVKYAVAVVVSLKAVEIDGAPVLMLREVDGALRLPEGSAFEAFAAALVGKRDAAVAAAAAKGVEAVPDMSIQCDRRVPWEVLGPLLTQAGDAGFGQFRFVVHGEEQ